MSGGAAGAAVSFFVTCKDSNSKRIPEGGARIEALVIPKSLAPPNEQVAVLIKDNGDGSYTGVYTVSARGNYEVRSKWTGSCCIRRVYRPTKKSFALLQIACSLVIHAWVADAS